MRYSDLSRRSKIYKCCKDCARRFENCHTSCEEYSKEVILGAMLEAEDRKEAAQREADYDVRESRAMRVANSCPSAKKAMQKNGYIRKRGR